MRKLFFSLLVLCMSAMVGCHNKKRSTTIPMRKLQVAEVRFDTIASPVSFTGQLSSNYSAVIQPRISGYLMSKHYKKGMPVKRGQLLYTIDPSQINTQLLAAEAELNSARAQAIEARNNYERAVPLAKIEAISRSQLDEYTAQYQSAQSAVKSAEQQLKNARLESGYTRLYSPIDGIIGQTNATEGDYVGVGTEFTVLATIENIDTVSVNISIPVSEYLERRETDTLPAYDNSTLLSNIRLYMSDGTLYPLRGSYGYTQPSVSSQTGTIVISVNFPNPSQILKSGQYARISADVGAAHPCAVIPQRSVVQDLDRTSVWVVQADSTLAFRDVVLGATIDSMWIIRKGLNRGERVLVEGLQRARNGEKIIPINNK